MKEIKVNLETYTPEGRYEGRYQYAWECSPQEAENYVRTLINQGYIRIVITGLERKP